MASMSEQRIVGAMVILIEGLISSTQDDELKQAMLKVYAPLMGYMAEKDKSRREKLAEVKDEKEGGVFDREAFNKRTIDHVREMAEVECIIERAQTASGKDTTKIILRDVASDKDIFLYVFKPFSWRGTRWVKGKDLASVLWVNRSGYLSLDAKKGESVLKAGTDRVTVDMDIPF